MIAQIQPTVTLLRTFAAGERAQYGVEGHMQAQARDKFMDKALPADETMSYKFTTEVLQTLPDGSAKIHYKRPTITETLGETYDSGPVTRVKKADMDFLFTISPTNEVIEEKRGKTNAHWIRPQEGQQEQSGLEDFMDYFMPDFYQLCGFTGSFDWALDIAPKLPLTPVKVGDTWSRTVGYQPQQKSGKKETVIQRVDTTYTYKGTVKEGAKTFVRVTANLKLGGDISAWANKITDGAAGLQRMDVKLDANVDFDLDPKTLRTIRATASSEGYLNVVPIEHQDEDSIELRLSCSTEMNLLGLSSGGQAVSHTKEGKQKNRFSGRR